MSDNFGPVIRKRIKSIARSYKKLGDKAHGVLADMLDNYVLKQDPQHFTFFMDEMKGVSMDRSAVAAWAAEYARLSYVKSPKGGYHFKPMRDDDNKAVFPSDKDAADGRANPFYLMGESDKSIAKDWDLLETLKKALDSYENRMGDPEKAEHVKRTVPDAMRDRLAKLIADAEKVAIDRKTAAEEAAFATAVAADQINADRENTTRDAEIIKVGSAPRKDKKNKAAANG